MYVLALRVKGKDVSEKEIANHSYDIDDKNTQAGFEDFAQLSALYKGFDISYIA